MDFGNAISFLPFPAAYASALFPVAVGLGSTFTHCAGMCGPIHLFLTARSPGNAAPWSFHAGRILGYGILGVTVGSLGGALEALSSPGFRAGTALALAAIYALFGLGLLGWMPGRFDAERLLGRLFPARAFRALSSGAAGRRPALFAAGVAASLLPCPSTHAVLLWGLGLASPAAAGAGMVALGIATLPVFAVLARGSRGIPARAKSWYRGGLGAAFLGLSAWRIYAWAALGAAACH